MPITPLEIMKLSKVGLLIWFITLTSAGYLIAAFIVNDNIYISRILGSMIIPFLLVCYAQFKTKKSLKLTD